VPALTNGRRGVNALMAAETELISGSCISPPGNPA
jgi:hypothetical protein